jgi:hypothetical protein
MHAVAFLLHNTFHHFHKNAFCNNKKVNLRHLVDWEGEMDVECTAMGLRM